MARLEDVLARYYDDEASARRVRPLMTQRVAYRAQFAGRLQDQGRHHLLEVGSGPGVDAAAFVAQGLRVTGVDLSPVAVAMCREAGVDAHVGSVLDLPFDDTSFDAAWTMSTLLHVPDASIHQALDELVRVCRPGAPIAIGVWAGEDVEGPAPFDDVDPPRFFSFRSERRLRELLAAHGELVDFAVWPDAAPERAYHVALLRRPADEWRRAPERQLS